MKRTARVINDPFNVFIRCLLRQRCTNIGFQLIHLKTHLAHTYTLIHT